MVGIEKFTRSNIDMRNNEADGVDIVLIFFHYIPLIIGYYLL